MMYDTSTVETVRSAVEQHPNVWLAVGVAVGPVATAALIGWVAIKYALPAIREEMAASREHMTEALARRGVEAADDIKASREIARVQHEAIIEKIEGKIDRLDEHARTSENILRAVAVKVGVVALVLLLAFGVGFGGGALLVRLHRPAPPSTSKGECEDLKCNEEEYCCMRSGAYACCQRSRSAHDEIARKPPLSSLPTQSLAGLATRPCDAPRLDFCAGQK